MIPTPPQRVGVVMLSTLGNMVHVLPVLNSLKRHFPGVQIAWIMQPAMAGLVRDHPAVDEVIPLHRSRGLRGWLELRAELARRRFDLVLVFQDYFKAGVVAAMTRAPIKLGVDRARARDLNWLFTTHQLAPLPMGHIQDQYLEYLDVLGVPARLEWGLEPTEEERARYASLLPPAPGPTVALVVGTTKPEKEWPAERYAELADRLHDELGARAVLVGGRSPRELAAAEAIALRAEHPPLDLLEWDLRRLVYLVHRADALVSPDTGPLHMGVALGTPSVALMGYTNPKRVGPYRFHDLLLDAYGDPGEDYPASSGYRPGRMERITVQQVLDKVRLALERYPRRSPRGQPGP